MGTSSSARIVTPKVKRPSSALNTAMDDVQEVTGDEMDTWAQVHEGDAEYTGIACDWCSRNKASMDYYIPCGDNRKCGHFCDWRCAKAWNQTRSPVQFRFIRDIRIDTLAKETVEPASMAWGRQTQES